MVFSLLPVPLLLVSSRTGYSSSDCTWKKDGVQRMGLCSCAFTAWEGTIGGLLHEACKKQGSTGLCSGPRVGEAKGAGRARKP